MTVDLGTSTDLGLIIAIVGTGATFIAAMVALFLWLRSESNSERRNFLNIQSEDRKDLLTIIRDIEESIREIKIENKDFHYRLLEIERERK